MKTILHIIFSLKIGGTENMLVDIVNEQAKQHSVVLLIIHNLIDYEVIDNLSKKVKLIAFGIKPPTKIPWFAIKLWNIIFKLNPDLIHLHNESALKLFPLPVKVFLPKSIFCFTLHTTGISIGQEAHNADYIFAISEAVKKDFIKRNSYKKVISIIHNGIKCSLFDGKSDFTLPDKFKIIQIGRLAHEIKGQDILLNSIALLNKTMPGLEIETTFIGDGQSRLLLEKMARSLGIEQQVFFAGAKGKKWISANLKKFDLLIQPSRVEGFGLTIVEGLVSKVPVLVSDIEGPMEVIHHGEFGHYFQTENIKDCANQILNVISSYRNDTIKNKTDNAYLYAIKKFDIETTANLYAKIIS